MPPGVMAGLAGSTPKDCDSCGNGSDGGGDDDECCEEDEEGGMPVWWIAQPRLIVFMKDKPLSYRPSAGSEVAFRLFFKNKQGANGTIDNSQQLIFSVGTNWHTPWRSYVQHVSSAFNDNYYVFDGNGSARRHILGFVEYDSRARFTQEGTIVTNFVLTSASGARMIYGTNITVGGTGLYFLTQMEDRHGFPIRFQYIQTNGVVRLDKVIDIDNRETTFEYITNTQYHLVSKVIGPFGLTNVLQYNAQSQLTNIMDSIQMSSTMLYDVSNRISKLITPYGTNAFEYYSSNAWSAIRATEYDIRRHLYLTGDGPTNLFSSAQDEYASLATYLAGAGLADTIDNTNLHQRNSYYWGPRQYGNLTTNVTTRLNDGSFDISYVSTNDFNKGWTKHWLDKDIDWGTNFLGQTVALVRQPSPAIDGTTEGLLIWYDQEGKSLTQENEEGFQPLPRLVAFKVGTSDFRVRYTERKWQGGITREENNYGEPGSAQWRVTTFQYGVNQIDQTGALRDFVPLYERGYNSRHQVTSSINGVDEETIYSFDAGNGNRLASTTYQNGLVSSNFYDGNGFLSSVVENSGGVNYRTNSYTYTNGNVYTHTDERGLTVTHVYDSLNRLTKRIQPDGSGVTNTYDKLDLTQVTDRMGFVTRYEYNRFRQITKRIDAADHTNVLQYCDCGSLESMTDPLGNPTSFTYDNLGRRTRVTYPSGGGYSDSLYDGAGQLAYTSDSAGDNLTNHYTISGSVDTASNSAGRLFLKKFDDEGHVVWQMDHNGVKTGFGYDRLGRLTGKTNHVSTADWPPDWGFDIYSTEHWEYTAGFLGPTFQYGPGIDEPGGASRETTGFNYDLFQRKTNEIRYTLTGYVPVTTTTFGYSSAGDLISLTDGNNQTTTWKYDAYGHVTNKVDAANSELFRYAYDANGRLTNRWTPAKGNTRYVYDNVGNLSLVDYASSTDISMGYDGNNRLTSMSDASGGSSFGYAAFGLLSSEDGPWSDDTISYSYANGRRTALSLQQLNASAWAVSYGYENAGRLQTITSPAGPFTYTYHSGLHSGVNSASPLVRNIALPGGAAITNVYEGNLARLESTTLLNSSRATLNSHGYLYDEIEYLNRRMQQTRNDGTAATAVDYGYDDLGQLTGASGYESGGARLHEQFGYTYDTGGNLQKRISNTLTQIFGVNNLNQLTNQSRSGRMTVAGTTSSAATNVTVNASNAVRYADQTFASTNHSLVNGTNTFIAIARDASNRVDTNIVVAYLPDSSVFVYDSNGNMVFDGQKAFDYDDENQLTRITATNAWKSEFTYDGQMRRRVRKEYTWRSSAWALTNEIRYIYDGNLPIQERDSYNIAQVTYTRGKDRSGSFEGAGGIGGLLARTGNTEFTIGAAQSHDFYHADGNGNITMLINTQQVFVAKYSYDPFGNTVALSGAMAIPNLYGFSSQERHFSGLMMYTFRNYVPSLQRWANPDPVDEEGFVTLRGKKHTDFQSWKFRAERDTIHLYSFVRNDPVRSLDVFGLSCFSECMDGEAPGLKDFVENCFCLAGLGGGAAAAGCFTGCLASTAAYPACVTACLAAVGVGEAVAAAACTTAGLAKAAGAAIGCALGCNF